jgi:GH35 family endo-1,4-beta-xylanase
MASSTQNALVRLDLNNPVFQENLLGLQKSERHAALDTLKKIRQLTWSQLYRDNGMKWEKINSVTPPPGIGGCQGSCRMKVLNQAAFLRV